ncbi:hypothetical protein HBI56_039470 [Parastagonospora nodorum]|nr:hypothetical protein HBH54_080790 [Parastagonospora nodorum]KAH3988145.1 hypothetical protein HBH51_004260 [Parastagonospora nodorum]KAH4004639.1 hypothetical protein HBI10_042770 [Parastagonospora nodorum]KAH4030898.1 hypothetical protein HBI13_026220 [Parastagonospora nodorum]KAH4056325.1 hypothetical protein HBH49_052030 [Parastagonospora nodorum]
MRPVSLQPSSKFVVYFALFSSPLHGTVAIVRLSIEKPATDNRFSAAATCLIRVISTPAPHIEGPSVLWYHIGASSMRSSH